MSILDPFPVEPLGFRPKQAMIRWRVVQLRALADRLEYASTDLNQAPVRTETEITSRCNELLDSVRPTDEKRFRWLLQFVHVARDQEGEWTCWLELEQIPFRSKTKDPIELLDSMIERFPWGKSR